MPTTPYYGAYARFSTPDKKEGSMLMGADNLVGDIYEIEYRVENGDQVPWLRNRFGKTVGFVEGEEAQELVLCRAKGWKTCAVLASVFYSSQPDPGIYWGEVALVCYPESEAESLDIFVQGISNMLAEGNRPTVDLGQKGYDQVLAAKGAWLPTTTQKKYDLKPGQALVKDHRSFNENMIELARKRHPGCMVVGWAFIITLVLGAIWLVKTLLGF